MSNESLIARIESTLSRVRSDKATAKTLSDSLRGSGRALEGMPYALVKEMESLAMDLEIAAWTDEDGFVPDLSSALMRLELWLSKVPKSV